MIYNYKKIQEMRNALKEEMVASGLTVVSIETEKLIEMRVQTAIMAGLFNDDINKEVKIRDKDK